MSREIYSSNDATATVYKP